MMITRLDERTFSCRSASVGRRAFVDFRNFGVPERDLLSISASEIQSVT
jgi:hypothetical protein